MGARGTFTSSDDRAIAITGTFEGDGKYHNITADDVGNGLSYGILQFNASRGPLLQMLRAMARIDRNLFRSCFMVDGENLSSIIENAMKRDRAEFAAWTRTIKRDEERLLTVWQKAFTKLSDHVKFNRIQDAACQRYIDDASSLARKLGLSSDRGFSLCFDTVVQNGSLMSSHESGSDGRAVRIGEKFDWTPVYQYRTSGMTREMDKLVELAWVVFHKCNQDVEPESGRKLNRLATERRKVAIATGSGTVNGISFDLERDFDLSDSAAVRRGPLEEAAILFVPPDFSSETPSVTVKVEVDREEVPARNIIPAIRPKINRDSAVTILANHGIDDAFALLGLRDYFKQMGTLGPRGSYADAMVLITPSTYRAFNGNTKPGLFRLGIASLKPGTYSYKIGNHRPPFPGVPYEALVQSGSVSVERDGKAGNTGRFGINIHRGLEDDVSSLGCQTIPPGQWDEFIALVKAELLVHNRSMIPYLLVEVRT